MSLWFRSFLIKCYTVYHRQKFCHDISDRRGWPFCLYNVYTVHLSFLSSARYNRFCCLVYVHMIFHWMVCAAFMSCGVETMSQWSSFHPSFVQIWNEFQTFHEWESCVKPDGTMTFLFVFVLMWGRLQFPHRWFWGDCNPPHIFLCQISTLLPKSKNTWTETHLINNFVIVRKWMGNIYQFHFLNIPNIQSEDLLFSFVFYKSKLNIFCLGLLLGQNKQFCTLGSWANHLMWEPQNFPFIALKTTELISQRNGCRTID